MDRSYIKLSKNILLAEQELMLNSVISASGDTESKTYTYNVYRNA